MWLINHKTSVVAIGGLRDPRVAGYGLRVTGCGLRVRRFAPAERKGKSVVFGEYGLRDPRVASCALRVTSCGLQIKQSCLVYGILCLVQAIGPYTFLSPTD